MKNNNNNIIGILSFGVILMIISGCHKYLDLEPQSEITDVTYWKTAGDFRLAANWFYPTLDDPQSGGTLNSDNMSDIAIPIQSDPVSSGTYTTPATDGNWNGFYSDIRNANKLIEKGESSTIKNDILPFLGEGYFFRAYN